VAAWSSAELKQRERDQWFGVLAGPLGWLVHLLASYGMSALACAKGWPGFTLFGWGGAQALIAGLTLAIEALIVAAGWRAYHHWRRLRDQGGRGGSGFDQWMAFAGLLLSGMFFIAVLFAGIPAIALRPCR
jgi:hypothetical protein